MNSGALSGAEAKLLPGETRPGTARLWSAVVGASAVAGAVLVLLTTGAAVLPVLIWSAVVLLLAATATIRGMWLFWGRGGVVFSAAAVVVLALISGGAASPANLLLVVAASGVVSMSRTGAVAGAAASVAGWWIPSLVFGDQETPVEWLAAGSTVTAIAGVGAIFAGFRWQAATERSRVHLLRLEHLLEHFPAAVYLLDPDGQVVYINQAGSELAGLPRDDIVGRSWTDFGPPAAAAAAEARLRAAQRGEAGLPTAARVERPGQETVPVVSSMIGDPTRPGYVFGLVIDVSPAEAARHETAQLIDSSPVALVLTDGAGMVDRSNAAAETLLETDPTGRHIDDALACERIDSWDDLVADAPFDDRLMALILPDGRERPVLATCQPRPGGTGWTLYLVDVSTVAELRDELSRAQRLETLGRLAGGVAHDVNNLLGVVTGRANLAARQITSGDPDLAIGHLQKLEHAAASGHQLVEQLLDAGGSRRRPQTPCDLFDVVRRERDLLEDLAGSCRFHLEATSEPCPVYVHEAQALQLVTNLITNAREATGDDGTISVSVQLSGDGRSVVLAVRDDGRGMDTETAARAFEPFFTARSGHQTGTGLGLAVVAGIVDQVAGQASIDSAPGAGTTVTLTLPAADRGPVEDDAGSDTTPQLLLVTARAETQMRQVLVKVLEADGLDVTVVDTPTAAADQVTEGSFDLVVTDLDETDRSGSTFLSAARRSSTPVLTLSGRDVTGTTPGSADRFAPAALLDAVEEKLEGHRTRRRRRDWSR